MIDFKADRKSADERWAKMIADEIKRGGAAADMAKAAHFAKNGAREDGLLPDLDDDGHDVYSPEQGAKAACKKRS
jgi:hypothetical protein